MSDTHPLFGDLGRSARHVAGETPAQSAYARFIPREEIGAFAAWTPEQFGAPPDAPPTAAAAPAPPPEPTAEQWHARVDAARQAGWADGYRDGLQALDAAKQHHAQQTTAQVVQVVAALQDDLGAMQAQFAQALVDTALLLARQVVRSELSQRPELVASVAADAVAAMVRTAQGMQLRLHPDDLALVQSGAGELLAERRVALRSDAAIARGGCVLDADLGHVDARIEQRWAQAAATFGRDLPLHGEAADAATGTGDESDTA